MYYFVVAQQTSKAKLPAFFQKLKKTVRALRVDEIKPTSRNAFIVDLLALESGK